MLDARQISELGAFYRHHLLVDVMPFWEQRTLDTQGGGYLTCFDRQGNLTDPGKYTVLQGRQLFTFSALFNRVENNSRWLEMARHGRDFIVARAYAGQGRFCYQLDRQGSVKVGTNSIYADFYALAGLAEYAVACQSDQDLALIREGYAAMELNLHDPEFKDIYASKWSPRYKRHGMYMMGLYVAGLVEPLLGAERTRPLADFCLEQVLHVFAKDEYQALFENVGRDGTFVDEPEGRVVNPGHTFESMWFCIEEGKRRHDRSIIQRAIQIADWAYGYGYDKDCGGFFSFLDSRHGAPTQIGWYKELGKAWDDKSFWVHTEGLYALAVMAIETDSQEYWKRFLDLHDWCQRHFYDPAYGEWYCEIHRDGTPKLTDKGTPWKAACHVPRALMMTLRLFEDYGRRPD